MTTSQLRAHCGDDCVWRVSPVVSHGISRARAVPFGNNQELRGRILTFSESRAYFIITWEEFRSRDFTSRSERIWSELSLAAREANLISSLRTTSAAAQAMYRRMEPSVFLY